MFNVEKLYKTVINPVKVISMEKFILFFTECKLERTFFFSLFCFLLATDIEMEGKRKYGKDRMYYGKNRNVYDL